MRFARLVSIAAVGTVAFGLVAACAFDWSFPGGVDPSKDAGDAGANDTGGGRDAIAFEGSVDASDEDSGPTVPPGECSPLKPCMGTDVYCDYADDRCGAGVTSQTGKCVSTKIACQLARQVCACGKTPTVYGDACKAALAGADLNANEAVACAGAPNGYFRCGPYYCKSTAELCVSSAAKGFDCRNTGCGGMKCVDCGETASLYASCTCTDEASGDLRMKCP